MLSAVQNCAINGTIYDGRTYRVNECSPIVTKSGSIDELIITDWIKQGLGFRNTAIMVKKYGRRVTYMLELVMYKTHSGE